MSLASAQPVLAAMRDSLPPGLKTGGAMTAGTWDKWVRRRDREIRDRVAENRADDPIRALAAPRIAGGMLEMRAFLEKKGFSLSTPEGRRKTKAYLLDCLARQRDDAAHTREEAKVDHSQAFKDRGLSTDSDLYPDYPIERHLREMAQKGLLKPGGVHRLAIVGPGLLLSAANLPAVCRHRFAGPTAPRQSRCHRSLYLRDLSTSQPAH